MCSIVLMGTLRAMAMPRGALENSLEALVDGKALHFFVFAQRARPDSYARVCRDAFEQALTRDSLPLSAYPGKRADPAVDMQSQEGRAELVKPALFGQGGRPHFRCDVALAGG